MGKIGKLIPKMELSLRNMDKMVHKNCTENYKVLGLIFLPEDVRNSHWFLTRCILWCETVPLNNMNGIILFIFMGSIFYGHEPHPSSQDCTVMEWAAEDPVEPRSDVAEPKHEKIMSQVPMDLK